MRLLILLLTLCCTATAAPSLLNHQGRIAINNVNHDGPGYFKFALVDAAGTTSYWTNDATASGEPAAAINIAVSKGHYALLLGETNPIPPSIFTANDDVRLRTWFSSDNLTFTQLTPDRRLTPAPYALAAASAASITPGYETGDGEQFSAASITGNSLTLSATFAQPFDTVPTVSSGYSIDSTTETGFNATTSFASQTIDAGGTHTSLAVINGRPAIAYRNDASGDLYFTRSVDRSGQSWPTQIRVAGAIDDVGAFASLAEIAGRPAIAFYDLTDGDLNYIRANDASGTSWPSNPVTVDGAAANVGRDCSLAVIDGRPAIAYQSPNTGEILYVRALDPEGATWGAIEIIEGTLADYRQHGSLIELADGNPAIAIHIQTSGNLRYASHDGTSWTVIEIDAIGKSPSLSLIDGQPGIAYESGATVKYTRYDGSTWSAAITLPNAAMPSLADINGSAAISFWDTTSSDLKLALEVDWNSPLTIDSVGNVGTHNSLAEVSGLPAIAYHDASNTTLKYAALPVANWTASKNGNAEPILASGVKAGGVTAAMLGEDIGTWQKSGDDLVHTGGKIGIGRLATANTLEVEGSASKTTAGSWLANSDRRIKTDIRDIDGALAKIQAIRLVDFRYTEEFRASHPSIERGKRYPNVIAQEFAEVFPEWVQSSGESLPGSDGEKILQVDTYPITIYTAAAVQELALENAELKKRVERLEELIEQIATGATAAASP